MRNIAIAFVLNKWGRVSDLPEELIPVVWVTAYQNVRAGSAAQSADHLRQDMSRGGDLSLKLVESAERVKFLDRMISIIRSEHEKGERNSITQLTVDCLKWNIVDAGSMSEVRRWLARKFAKASRDYEMPVPREIL